MPADAKQPPKNRSTKNTESSDKKAVDTGSSYSYYSDCSDTADMDDRAEADAALKEKDRKHRSPSCESKSPLRRRRVSPADAHEMEKPARVRLESKNDELVVTQALSDNKRSAAEPARHDTWGGHGQDTHNDDCRKLSHRNTRNREDTQEATPCNICGKWVKDLRMHKMYSTRCYIKRGGADSAKLQSRCDVCHKMVATSGLEQHRIDGCKGPRPWRLNPADVREYQVEQRQHQRNMTEKESRHDRSEPVPSSSGFQHDRWARRSRSRSRARSVVSCGSQRRSGPNTLQTAAVSAMATFLRDMAGMMDEQQQPPL